MTKTDKTEAESGPAAGFEWRREGRRRARCAGRADLSVLAEMIRGTARYERLLPEVGSPSHDEVWRSAPRARLVEYDGQINAAVALHPGLPRLTPGRHPWSVASVSDRSLVEPTDLPAPALFVAGMIYHQRNDHRVGPPAWLLDGPIQRTCQRIGAGHAVALVAPDRSASERGLRSAAFLQQLYFGAIDDPMLSPFVNAGFEPRGLVRADTSRFSEDRTLLVWENARQG